MGREKATHRGRCPACERIVALRLDGNVVTHWVMGNRAMGDCPGAGCRPQHGSVTRTDEPPAQPGLEYYIAELELGITRNRPRPELLELCAQLAARV